MHEIPPMSMHEKNSHGLFFNVLSFVKFMLSKKATKTDEIFTVDLTIPTYCQIDCEDFINFCGLLRKREV